MINKKSILILTLMFSLCVFAGCSTAKKGDEDNETHKETPLDPEKDLPEEIAITYYKIGLNVETVQKGKTITLNPYIYDNGKIVDVEAEFSVSDDCVSIQGKELTANEYGKATITSTITYNGVEYTDTATIEVKNVASFASVNIDGKDVNTNISFVANKKLEKQVSLTVYDNEKIEEYSLAFVGKSDVLIGNTSYSLNSLYNVVYNHEVVGQVVLAFYVKSGENYLDIISDSGVVKYTEEYEYGYYFGNLVLNGENIECSYIKDAKVNVLNNNVVIDLSSITASKVNAMFVAGPATSVSLSDNIKYRDVSTIRFNTMGEWYPIISLTGIYNYIKSNNLSEATVSFKVYFDIDYTDNISLSMRGMSDNLMVQGTIEPKKWLDISIELDKNTLNGLSDLVLLPLMVSSSGKVTGSDYSIYFTEFSLGQPSYYYDVLQFEKDNYQISDVTPFKMNIDGDLVGEDNPILGNLVFDVQDKSIVSVKNGKLYPLKDGTTTISIRNGENLVSTTVEVQDAPNGFYHLDAIDGNSVENVFSVVNGSTKAKTDKGAVSVVKDGDDYCIRFEEFAQKGEWYKRYIQLNGTKNTLKDGDTLKIVLKHNYSDSDNLYLRAYNSHFFNDVKIEEKAKAGQMTDWITLLVQVRNVPQDVDLFFTLCDSEGETAITSLIKEIGVVDSLGEETDNGLYSFGTMDLTQLNAAFGGNSVTTFSVVEDDTYGAVLKVSEAARQAYVNPFVFKTLYQNEMAEVGNYLHLRVKFLDISSQGIFIYSYYNGAYNFTNKRYETTESDWVDLYIEITNDVQGDWYFEFFDDGRLAGTGYAAMEMLIATIEFTTTAG